MAASSRPPQPPAGIEFPKDQTGRRSSTEPTKNALAATFCDDEKKRDQVLNVRNWRWQYDRLLEEHVRYSLEDPQRALDAATAGLDTFYKTFEFYRNDKQYTIEEAFSDSPPFELVKYRTGIRKGAGKSHSSYQVPYKSGILSGDDLARQARAWHANGSIERDTADALCEVARHDDWVAKLKQRYFVLLGAGAAMGPLECLLSHGANVIALDLAIPAIWKRLFETTDKYAGTLIFPLSPDVEDPSALSSEDLTKKAGCDIIKNGPDLAAWLASLYPSEPLTIGNYVYLDGEFFVRVSLACDAIMSKLCKSRPNTAIAFLCTPTDLHMIPEQTWQAARHNATGLRHLAFLPFTFSPIRLLRLVKNTRPAVQSTDGKPIYYVDGIVPDQGPNYALAKRMQHWRSIVARSQGHYVSTNIAPSTATVSVLKNRTFAWAYDGLPIVCPQIEIFYQETSNAVMTGLLINDLFNPNSVADPKKPLRNPLELFAHTSFHGGVWTMPYTMKSTGAVSVIMHFVKVLLPFLILLLVIIAYLSI